MQGNFDRIMDFVLKWEGGYCNDADDRGGETKFGIAKKFYPQLEIRELTELDAIAIYRRDYWPKIQGDKLPWPLDLVVMDACVNHGPSRAGKLLQQAIGGGLAVDGKIGPKTLAALVGRDAGRLAADVNLAREMFYHRIVESDATQRKFLDGWLNRVADLRREIKRVV